MKTACRLTAGALAIGMALPAVAAEPPKPIPTDGRLVEVLQTDLLFNGVTVSADGRIFMPFQRQVPNEGIELGEMRDGQPQAFPDAAWNGWSEGQPADTAFVGVNAIRIGPDGALWVVDKGAPAMGEPVIAGGPKAVRIDLATNAVTRVYPLDAATMSTSFVDDIRFNGRRAYLTDAGKPGLIVLDLETGDARRVLEGHFSTIARRPASGEGKTLYDPDGRPVFVHADQLEVSPDGRWLYFQPGTGPMERIGTVFLDDFSRSGEDLASRVETFRETGSTGGTAMDAAGNIYVSDTDALSVSRIAPDGTMTTIVRDPRLVWVDAMWIDDQGYLWMPAAQLNRTAGLNGGHAALQPPFRLFKLKIDAAPLRR